MGEAILSRGGGSITFSGTDGNALIRVETFSGASVTCSQGSKTFTKNSAGLVEFSVGYGTWTVSTTYNSKTRTDTVDIDTLMIYELNHKGNTYGVSIDMTSSSPNDAVTYIGQAVGFTPLSCNLSSGACNYGSWKDIITEVFGVKPCLYKSGARSVYLNPNDYTKTESGTAADITSGNAGDVMVEFKKCWYRYAKTGNILTFEVADYDRSADGFVDTAFASMDGTGAIKDYMYFGAYEGNNISNKVRSLSGKTPTASVTYSNFRTYCKANGSTYGMEDWVKRYYILGLLMLVTKSRGIQDVVGHGRIVSNSSAVNTGTLNTYGLFAGFSDNTKAVKCFGIENMWGSLYNWCDGIITTSGTTLGMKASAPYNDSGSGYTTIADGFGRGSWLYPTTMIPVLNGATIVASIGQSSGTIGWPDGVYVNSNSGRVAYVGGRWSDALDQSGPFCAFVNDDPTHNNTVRGARLVAA